MQSTGEIAFLLGAFMSAAAAIAHLACIALGAQAYRIMGAGERMARSVEAGKLRPTLVTLAISGVLLVWAAYALGGAGVIAPLPFSGLVLPVICATYLGRAVAFPLLRSSFPENSEKFWLVSSGICLVIGSAHPYGILSWSRA
jgi:hypothetical protein